jgi:hypothetical protein
MEAEMINIQFARIITNRDIANRHKDYQSFYETIGIDPSSIELDLSSGKLIIIDPIYLADIYNENGEKERYLKENGVLLNDFGGDVGGPIVRTQEGGIMILLLFDRMDAQGRPLFEPDFPEELKGVDVLCEELGCDSGSYIFLDYNRRFRSLFHEELKEEERNFALINLNPGKYGVGYEQWETDTQNPYEAWRRNLVVWPIR